MAVLTKSGLTKIESIDGFSNEFETIGWNNENFDVNLILGRANGRDLALLIVAHEFFHIGTCQRHIKAICMAFPTDIAVVDIKAINKNPDVLSFFSSVVIHYTVASFLRLSYPLKVRLACHQAPKMIFLQDEYRLISQITQLVEQLGISAIFTTQNEDVTRAIYRTPYMKSNVLLQQVGLDFTCPTRVFEKPVNWENRKFDLTYRAMRLPKSYGRDAFNKAEMGVKIKKALRGSGLKADISTEETDRLYGAKWEEFLYQSKAAFATSSSISVVDFDGELYKKQIDELEKGLIGEFPNSDCLINVSALSPRFIEYAIAGCMPVLLESHFDGLLEPHLDYFPIKNDLTGLAGLKEAIEDNSAAQKIIYNFQRKIASYEMFSIKNLNNCIENALEKNVMFHSYLILLCL